MKKTDVYVVVDTPKKAKKLKKLLDMFGEKLYRFDTIEHCLNNNKMMAFSTNWNWFALGFKDYETKVSIKELRNILAKEHLKEGDVVLTKNGNDKIIAVVNKTCNSNVALFEAKRWIRLHDGFKCDNKGCFDDFIRYATEEEKALLEPVDKLANLKEAFNNGYCVELYDEKTDTWKRHENPCWNHDLQWRIMVNNGHLVVSDIYLLNQIKELKKSIEVIKSNIRQ